MIAFDGSCRRRRIAKQPGVNYVCFLVTAFGEPNANSRAWDAERVRMGGLGLAFAK